MGLDNSNVRRWRNAQLRSKVAVRFPTRAQNKRYCSQLRRPISPCRELGHSQIRIRTQGVKYGQYPDTVLAELGHSQNQIRPLCNDASLSPLAICGGNCHSSNRRQRPRPYRVPGAGSSGAKQATVSGTVFWLAVLSSVSRSPHFDTPPTASALPRAGAVSLATRRFKTGQRTAQHQCCKPDRRGRNWGLD
jgi:hypothetical protein